MKKQIEENRVKRFLRHNKLLLLTAFILRLVLSTWVVVSSTTNFAGVTTYIQEFGWANPWFHVSSTWLTLRSLSPIQFVWEWPFANPSGWFVSVLPFLIQYIIAFFFLWLVKLAIIKLFHLLKEKQKS